MSTGAGAGRPTTRRIRRVGSMAASLLLVVLVGATALALAEAAGASSCERLNDGVDGPYWEEMATCQPCVAAEGCGYCVSTMRCEAGAADGPADGAPCPDWVSDEFGCPVLPNCDHFHTCTECAALDECAWCAAEDKCTTIAGVFNTNCRGTVFDLPCPGSFVENNVVVRARQLALGIPTAAAAGRVTGVSSVGCLVHSWCQIQWCMHVC